MSCSAQEPTESLAVCKVHCRVAVSTQILQAVLSPLSQAQELLYADSTDYYHGGKLTVKNGKIDKYYFDGGYAQAKAIPESNNDEFAFFYYNSDHLGNIREVINEQGDVVQITNYYPFGTPYSAEDFATHNPDQQTHKYNGKEFDTMHGLNTYDYGARQYSALLGRWDRIDPLCEKYYSVSPYAYCANNPVKYVDPDGRKIRIYPENQKQVLGYINKVAQGIFAVDKNGYLYLAKTSNTKGYSATYTKSLLNAIKNEDKTINIYISDHYINSDGSKQSLSKKGEGTTTVTSDGTIVVAISGKSYDNLEDKEGNPISDDPEYILAHELAGHAEPNMNKTDDDSVGNAVEIENTIRRETYKEERKEEPWHVW